MQAQKEVVMDYSAYDEEEQLGHNRAAALADLATKLQEEVKEIERLTDLLDEAKQRKRMLEEKTIPEFMGGMDGKTQLPDGRQVNITSKTYASMTGEKKAAGMRWLEENGYGSLLSRKIIVEFTKAQQDEYNQFMEQFSKIDMPLNLKEETGVHHATLSSFVNEKLKKGEELPTDVLGIYHKKNVKVIEPEPQA